MGEKFQKLMYSLTQVGIMVTASADKLIKLWKAGVNTHTLSGHTDAVRSLAVISSEEFLSASNDATVRRWSRTGDCLGTFYGHENYIYSVALLSSSATQVKKKISVLLYIVIHYHGQKDLLKCKNFIKMLFYIFSSPG